MTSYPPTPSLPCDSTPIVFAAWGLVPLVVALTFVYARNLYRWLQGEGQ